MQRIDALVHKEWLRGAKSFRALLAKLPGIFPSEVICSLRRLALVDKISEVELLSVELEVVSRPNTQGNLVSRTTRHIEHPLDFEWRFTKQGVARICDEIDALQNGKPSEVLCLGCPSVYLLGRQHKFRLWDKNTLHLGQLDEANEVSKLDISSEMPGGKIVDVVVIDPPWYNTFYFSFLWAAFNHLARNGKVILSFPPLGTRPMIKDELRELKQWCAEHGLKVEKSVPNYLPYRAPLFEVNALRVQGIANFPIDWRRGDLIVLSKQSDSPFDKPKLPGQFEVWQEVQVQNCRVKVSNNVRRGDPVFAPVGSSEILPSVSSRHKLRREANVVTSGNRFFRTNSPEALLACLREASETNHQSMHNSFIASKNPLLRKKVAELISKENKEAAHYFRRINEF